MSFGVGFGDAPVDLDSTPLLFAPKFLLASNQTKLLSQLVGTKGILLQLSTRASSLRAWTWTAAEPLQLASVSRARVSAKALAEKGWLDDAHATSGILAPSADLRTYLNSNPETA